LWVVLEFSNKSLWLSILWGSNKALWGWSVSWGSCDNSGRLGIGWSGDNSCWLSISRGSNKSLRGWGISWCCCNNSGRFWGVCWGRDEWGSWGSDKSGNGYLRWWGLGGDGGRGWVLVVNTWLVGSDGGSETVLIGNIVNLTVDAIGIGVTVRSFLVTISVTFFVLVVAVSISIIDIVSEVVWLRSLYFDG